MNFVKVILPYALAFALGAFICASAQQSYWNRKAARYEQERSALLQKLNTQDKERLQLQARAQQISEERSRYERDIEKLRQETQRLARRRPVAVAHAPTVMDRQIDARDYRALRAEFQRLCAKFAELTGEPCLTVAHDGGDKR